ELQATDDRALRPADAHDDVLIRIRLWRAQLHAECAVVQRYVPPVDRCFILQQLQPVAARVQADELKAPPHAEDDLRLDTPAFRALRIDELAAHFLQQPHSEAGIAHARRRNHAPDDAVQGFELNL